MLPSVLNALFDWALIALSSVIGSTLIVQALFWDPRVKIILYVALIAAGILFQTRTKKKHTIIHVRQNESRIGTVACSLVLRLCKAYVRQL